MNKYTRPKIRVDWIPPTISRQPKTSALMDLDARSGIMEFIRDLGYFQAQGAETPKEELSVLLEVSAEVEHALLLQYLFAAYSIDPDVSQESTDTQRRILDIAIQEMAHFITVQNLILAIDGPAA